MFTVRTLISYGLRAIPVTVSAKVDPGPSLVFHGVDKPLASELGAIVRGSCAALGVELPSVRVDIVAEVPAAVGEISSLAVVVAVMGALAPGLFPGDVVVLGEVNYQGKTRARRGVFSALRTLPSGTRAIVPADNAKEAAYVGMAGGPQLQISAPASVEEIPGALDGRYAVEPRAWAAARVSVKDAGALSAADIALVRDSVEAAAKGRHVLWTCRNLAGVAVLAQRVLQALGPLSEQQAAELTELYSAIGQLPQEGVVRSRPFRAPHHTCSPTALLGGGDPVRPGELSLAHHGVLFLDDVDEMRRVSLEPVAKHDGTTLEVYRGKLGRTSFHAAPAAIIGATSVCPCRLSDCACDRDRVARHRMRVEMFRARATPLDRT